MEKAQGDSRESAVQQLQELRSREDQTRDGFQQSLNDAESTRQQMIKDLEDRLLAKQNECNELKAQLDIKEIELKRVREDLFEERFYNSRTLLDHRQKIAHLTAQVERLFEDR